MKNFVFLTLCFCLHLIYFASTTKLQSKHPILSLMILQKTQEPVKKEESKSTLKKTEINKLSNKITEKSSTSINKSNNSNPLQDITKNNVGNLKENAPKSSASIDSGKKLILL